jgi:SAM-dependent methyltransferase
MSESVWSPPGPAGPDWSIGRYEEVDGDLRPAAPRLVEAADVHAGHHVVDVGCGSGNASLAAAALGARVVGVDPAVRLLEVARDRASAAHLGIEFVPGSAAALPVDDASADLVLSAFGVIFAPDPRAAAAELARVRAPGGRIVLTAWLSEGPIVEVNRLAAAAVTEALGTVRSLPPFPWHDGAAVAELFLPHGLRVSLTREELTVTDTSPAAYLDRHIRHHPLAVGGLAVVDRHGDGPALRRRVLDVLEAAAPRGGFRVISRYVVATVG